MKGIAWGALLLPFLGGELLGELAAQGTPSFADAAWNREGADSELVQHKGRESLLLRGGLVWLPDVQLRNGVLEFDVALPNARGYIGAVLRLEEQGEYEHFYLRPHRTGKPDAFQYTPVFNGRAAWQLYAGPESTAQLDFAFDRWTQVRIVFWEERAQVFVDSEKPICVARLRRSPEAGAIGLTAPGFAPAHFSNVRFHPLTESPFAKTPAPEEAVPGALLEWSVSEAFAESRLDGLLILDEDVFDGRTWASLRAEPTGLTNLAQRQGVTPQADTRFARVQLISGADQLVPLDFGFSDRVRVFLDGRLLYVGDDTYASRDHRFLGTVGAYDRLVLPLHEGSNELVFAVTENFGGWGLLARLPPDAPVLIE